MRSLIIVFTLAASPTFANYHYYDGFRYKRILSAPGGTAVYSSGGSDSLRPHRHLGLWFTPNRRSTEIDGIALGIWAAPERHVLIIKGVNVEANPVAPVLGFLEIVGCIFGQFTNDTTGGVAVYGSKLPGPDTIIHATISGLSLTTVQIGGSMKGVGINLVSSSANEMEGLEVSGILNLHYRSRGLFVAIRNKVTFCDGVQIGVFNQCREGNLLQIGLLNRIGNRILPFINIGFRSKR